MSALCQKRTHALQQTAAYSITSSAATSRARGIVMPNAFAVLVREGLPRGGDQLIVTQSQQFVENRCESHLQPSRNCETLQECPQ
jgi:hypothetical protein